MEWHRQIVPSKLLYFDEKYINNISLGYLFVQTVWSGTFPVSISIKMYK